ncbi:MAG: glycosyltransferase family 4 protein [Sulfuricurvum sp.]|jgi:glycosyltransferase involved in cell wall biosynthesis
MKNKKVLVAIPCLLLGGTEYQTLNLVKALRDSGYDVKVICYFEHDSRMVAYMRNTGAEVILMSESSIRPKGFFAKASSLFNGFRNALKSYKPDIVHVQYMAPGSLAILLFKLLGAKKVLATAHVPGHIYKNTSVPRFITQYMTELFLCVSKSSEHAFFDSEPHLYDTQLHLVGRKHFTVYNCTDIPEQQPRSTTNHPLTLGVVSRLSHEKGIDILIRAMPKILSLFPDLRLLIVGDGARRQALQTLSIELYCDHAITWAGLQPKELLESYYAQMDIVVIPSRFEGFGLTAIEAMSYSIPVIASSVDGLAEVIEDQKSGMLVKPEDPSALVDAIVSLMQDPDQRQQIGENGYKRVKATFAYNIYQKTIASMYSTLMKGSSR